VIAPRFAEPQETTVFTEFQPRVEVVRQRFAPTNVIPLRKANLLRIALDNLLSKPSSTQATFTG
jgi:hypothetical protein